MSENDFGWVHKKQNYRKSKTSYGIILFNEEGKFCAIKNETSYAFRSFMLALKNLEFLNFESLWTEFKDEEAQLIKDNWNKEGINDILTYYEQKCGDWTRKSLDPFLIKIKRRWVSLINTVNLETLPEKRTPRYWDLPKAKGSESKKWNLITAKFLEETGCQIPSLTKLGRWVTVNYCSSDNIEYNMEFIFAKGPTFNFLKKNVEWIDLESQNFKPEILEILQKAKQWADKIKV